MYSKNEMMLNAKSMGNYSVSKTRPASVTVPRFKVAFEFAVGVAMKEVVPQSMPGGSASKE